MLKINIETGLSGSGSGSGSKEVSRVSTKIKRKLTAELTTNTPVTSVAIDRFHCRAMKNNKSKPIG